MTFLGNVKIFEKNFSTFSLTLHRGFYKMTDNTARVK